MKCSVWTASLAPLLAASLFLAVAPAAARSGSGSDGAIDDKIEEDVQDDIEKEIEKEIEDRLESRIDDRIEKRAEDKAREKAREKAEDKAREKAEEKSRDKTRERAGDKIESRSEERVRERSEKESRDGKDRFREESRSRTKTESREKTRSGVGATLSSGGALDKISADLAKDKAKAEFEIAVAAADVGRDVARAEARAARDAALAEPGADEEAIKAAYKTAVKAADEQRDVARDEAKETYEAALELLDDDHSGHGSGDDDVVAAAGRAFLGATDPNGDEIARGEWLLLTTPAEVEVIVKRGFAVKSVEAMKGLDLVMARLEAPESFSLPATSAAVRAETPSARVDYNHLYFPETEGAVVDAGDEPAALMPIAGAAKGAGVRIGVIDTTIDTAHPAFRAARVFERNFVPYENARPDDHGTAVASIIAGEDDAFKGLAPKAEIVAASVFFRSESGKAAATTESLVRALDWMSATGTPIVSMSLAGPPNSILEAAIARAAQRGVLVVAAAGNEGPMARPMYPAAYQETVAVTAVSRDKKVYRLANRGDYVDLAAPGVSVRHATSGGGYAASSGTSMAAPFVAAALAELRRDDARTGAEALQLLIENAEDLGEAGRDPVYGAGLIRPVAF